MAARVRVYIACSLDGFIAGPGDDLSWLGDPLDGGEPDAGAVTFERFLGDIGAMLMGRRTYDVVQSFDVPWPYGDIPVFVPTTRPMTPVIETVHPTQGDIRDLVNDALEAAQGRDVYVDGGQLVRQAIDADLVDELIVTIAPILLGSGVPLFAGLQSPVPLAFERHHTFGSMVQLVARPEKRT